MWKKNILKDLVRSQLLKKNYFEILLRHIQIKTMFTIMVRLFNDLLNMTRSPLIPLGELLYNWRYLKLQMVI
jgi:hypothetical protein